MLRGRYDAAFAAEATRKYGGVFFPFHTGPTGRKERSGASGFVTRRPTVRARRGLPQAIRSREFSVKLVLSLSLSRSLLQESCNLIYNLQGSREREREYARSLIVLRKLFHGGTRIIERDDDVAAARPSTGNIKEVMVDGFIRTLCT